MGQIYTVKEVADMLRVSERTVRNYCQDGYLRAYNFKREYRITEESLQDFLKQNEVKGDKENGKQN